MTQTGTKLQPNAATAEFFDEPNLSEVVSFTSVEGMPPTTVMRVRLLWDERRLLLRAALVGLLVGTLLAFVIPKRFESTTQLMPPDNQTSTAMAMLTALTARGGPGLGNVAGDMLGIKSSGALFVGILRSRTVEDRLIDQFDLKNVYWTKLQLTARRKLEENTAVSEDRKSGILTITVSDRDPQRAAAMARSYVVELDRLVAKVSTSSARREREFLEGRLKNVQSDLEQAEKDFSQFASKNTTIDIKEQGKAMVEAAAVLQGQLIAAQSELEGLRQIYTDNNVRVRSVQARINELKVQLEKLGGKGGAEAGKEQDSLYPSIRKLPLLGVDYADLYRRTKVQEAVFEALTQQYELAKVQEAKEIPSVKVLDDSRVPERKSFPPRALIVFFSTFFGLVCASIYAMAKARWTKLDNRDPGKALALEVFQTVKAQLPWSGPNGSGSHTASAMSESDTSSAPAGSNGDWAQRVPRADSVGDHGDGAK